MPRNYGGCMPAKKISQEVVIARFKAAHAHEPDRYDYSRVVYDRAIGKVEIKCNKCGNWFFQRARWHWRGHGCAKCNLGTEHLRKPKR